MHNNIERPDVKSAQSRFYSQFLRRKTSASFHANANANALALPICDRHISSLTYEIKHTTATIYNTYAELHANLL